MTTSQEFCHILCIRIILKTFQPKNADIFCMRGMLKCIRPFRDPPALPTNRRLERTCESGRSLQSVKESAQDGSGFSLQGSVSVCKGRFSLQGSVSVCKGRFQSARVRSWFLGARGPSQGEHFESGLHKMTQRRDRNRQGWRGWEGREGGKHLEAEEEGGANGGGEGLLHAHGGRVAEV